MALKRREKAVFPVIDSYLKDSAIYSEARVGAPLLTAEADRGLCQLLMFLTVFFTGYTK